MPDSQKLIDAIKTLVMRHDGGGVPYFNIQQFLTYRRDDKFRRYCPSIGSEGVDRLYSVGLAMKDLGILLVGIDIDVSAQPTAYINQKELITLIINGAWDYGEEDKYLILIDERAVPHVQIFSNSDARDVENRGVMIDDGWLEKHASEYGIDCVNFAAAQAILSESCGILDPFEYPYRYAVPLPKIQSFLRYYLGLINDASRDELVKAYRHFRGAYEERDRIIDEHTVAEIEEDWE